MRNIDTVFVHCAATRKEWMSDQPTAAKVAEIRRWHKARGWRDIGYHWVIDRDGTVAPGRDEAQDGAHVAGYNDRSIGVCLIGGHGSEATDDFGDHFTRAQEVALRRLLTEIKRRHVIRHIRGHNEVAAKACPGFSVGAWLLAEPEPATEPASDALPAWLAALIAWLTKLGAKS